MFITDYIFPVRIYDIYIIIFSRNKVVSTINTLIHDRILYSTKSRDINRSYCMYGNMRILNFIAYEALYYQYNAKVRNIAFCLH